MISVALCTYNGEKFLAQQINSILNQSYPVDEIIICDDCSTDNTIEIIKNFQRKPGCIIKLVVNEVSLGAIKNFEKAISLCIGEIVFLSDQDDIWLENKVKTIIDKFENEPSLEAIFSDAELIDDKGNSLNKTLFDQFFFSKAIQENWANGQALIDLIYDRSRITGATLAVKKELCNRAYPVNMSNKVWHDAYLGMNAAANAGLGWINEPLIQYRIHNNQQVGIGNGTTVVTGTKRTTLQKHLKDLEEFYSNRLLIVEYLVNKYPKLKKETLEKEGLEWINYSSLRLSLPQNIFKRVLVTINSISLYRRHSNFFLKSMIKDIVSPCN